MVASVPSINMKKFNQFWAVEKEENPVWCGYKASSVLNFEIIDLFDVLMKAMDFFSEKKKIYPYIEDILPITLRNQWTP